MPYGWAEREATASIDQIIGVTRPQAEREADRIKTCFRRFLDQVLKPGQVIPGDVETNIKHWIGQIDHKLSAQLAEIMHHPDFQRLEATWRGLHYLVHQSETGDSLKIRILNVSKRQLFEDLKEAAEFDQSALFQRIYEEEYGSLSGCPYGLLVGDYDFGPGPEDISLLTRISQVAAAAHAPFVAAASPWMFNLERFDRLPRSHDLAQILEGISHGAWKSFRGSEDSRYVALTLPRVLARLPYGRKFRGVPEFNFEELADGDNRGKFLWMSAAWGYAVRVTDTFAKNGWFMRLRGVEGGGKVEGLPVHTVPTDDGDTTAKCPTEIAISDRREFELSNLGFLPLLHNKDTDNTVFMGAQSCQKPQTYFDPVAYATAELSAKFNVLLCASRFVHYLKVLARDLISASVTIRECERQLNHWINQYVLPGPDADAAKKARYPLSEARVEMLEVKSIDRCEMVVWLSFHIDEGIGPYFIRLETLSRRRISTT
jgi:type VI secretion system protein ImpC